MSWRAGVRITSLNGTYGRAFDKLNHRSPSRRTLGRCVGGDEKHIWREGGIRIQPPLAHFVGASRGTLGHFDKLSVRIKYGGEGGIRTLGRDLWSRQPLSRRPHSTTLAPPQYSFVKQAEGEGFEPTVSCPTPVFKTGALSHSAIPPVTAGNAAQIFYHSVTRRTRNGIGNRNRYWNDESVIPTFNIIKIVIVGNGLCPVPW